MQRSSPKTSCPQFWKNFYLNHHLPRVLSSQQAAVGISSETCLLAAPGNSLRPLSRDPRDNLIKVYKQHIKDATCSGLGGGSGSHTCSSSVRQVTGSFPTAAPTSCQGVRDRGSGVSVCQVWATDWVGRWITGHRLFSVTDGFYYKLLHAITAAVACF